MSERALHVARDLLDGIPGSINLDGMVYVPAAAAAEAISIGFQRGVAEGAVGGELKATLDAERCDDEGCDRCAVLAGRLAAQRPQYAVVPGDR